jgi:hypothetical protein
MKTTMQMKTPMKDSNEIAEFEFVTILLPSVNESHATS